MDLVQTSSCCRLSYGLGGYYSSCSSSAQHRVGLKARPWFCASSLISVDMVRVFPVIPLDSSDSDDDFLDKVELIVDEFMGILVSDV